MQQKGDLHLYSSRPLLNEVRCTGGLVGYDVDPDVEAKLTALYTETLAELESIPESSEYRINVAKITINVRDKCH